MGDGGVAFVGLVGQPCCCCCCCCCLWRAQVVEQHEVLSRQLEWRAQASCVRSTLELLLNTSHVVSKVDKLLEEIRTTVQTDASADTSSKARLIERVASEINRLRFYCSRGAELPLVTKMESKAESAESSVKQYLDRTLAEALAEVNEAAVFHCFNAYSALHIPEAAESVVKDKVVRKIVEVAIAETDAKSGEEEEEEEGGKTRRCAWAPRFSLRGA